MVTPQQARWHRELNIARPSDHASGVDQKNERRGLNKYQTKQKSG
jgi:hypothetical protein